MTSDLSTQLERLLRQNFWYDRATNRYSEPTADQRTLMDTTEREEAIHDAERFLAGHLSRAVSDDDRCRWIGHLYEAASAAEEFDETAVTDDDTPHQLRERARVLYEQMTPRFQGVLKEHVDAKLYSLASRQVRTASRKLQHHQEARQAAEEVTKAKPDAQKRLF